MQWGMEMEELGNPRVFFFVLFCFLKSGTENYLLWNFWKITFFILNFFFIYKTGIIYSPLHQVVLRIKQMWKFFEKSVCVIQMQWLLFSTKFSRFLLSASAPFTCLSKANSCLWIWGPIRIWSRVREERDMHYIILAELHLYRAVITMEESCFFHKISCGQVFNNQASGLST